MVAVPFSMSAFELLVVSFLCSISSNLIAFFRFSLNECVDSVSDEDGELVPSGVSRRPLCGDGLFKESLSKST